VRSSVTRAASPRATRNLPNVQPILLTPRREPSNDPRWFFEAKYDGYGYRGLLYVARNGCWFRSKRWNILKRFDQALLLDLGGACRSRKRSSTARWSPWTLRVRRWTAAVPSSDHSLLLEDGPNAQRYDQEARQDHEGPHRDALTGPCPDRCRHDAADAKSELTSRIMMSSPILLTGELFVLLSFVPAIKAQNPGPLDSVDQYGRAEVARQGIPGLSVAILRGDSVLMAHGYGYANLEGHAPATDSTVYEIGSVRKQFTAAAVMMLAEQGRLSLDDPIIRYLPEGSAVWRGVTVRHLLTHTSGITDAVNNTLDWWHDYTDEELVRLIATPGG
jgi:Beta-lactamase